MSWDDLVEVVVLTTSDGPFTDDVFLMLTYADGTSSTRPFTDADLLGQLQELPGFDNEAFVEAMCCAEEGVSVLWRRASGDGAVFHPGP